MMILTHETYAAAARRLEALATSPDLGQWQNPGETSIPITACEWAIQLNGAAQALLHHEATVGPAMNHQPCEEVANNYHYLCESVWEFFRFRDSPAQVWRERSEEILRDCARELRLI